MTRSKVFYGGLSKPAGQRTQGYPGWPFFIGYSAIGGVAPVTAGGQAPWESSHWHPVALVGDGGPWQGRVLHNTGALIRLGHQIDKKGGGGRYNVLTALKICAGTTPWR